MSPRTGARRSLLPAIPLLIVLALVGAACGGGGDDDGASPQAPPSSAPAAGTDGDGAPTTTTEAALAPPTTRGLPEPVDVDPLPASMPAVTVLSGEPAYRGVLGQLDPDRYVVEPVALPPAPAAPGIAPLTGLALDDPAAAGRPAILAKIDNTAKGRPQASLTRADLVYEEQIEGGFTRLAVVFHSRSPEIGPVRSGRSTDIALLGSLNTPIFAWSGANKVHGALLRRQDIVDLGAQTRSEYRRDPSRPGTYDLMTDAETLLDIAGDRGGTPPPHFEYRGPTTGLPAGAADASTVTIDFPSVTATWDWDGGAWVRTQDGTAHLDADGERVAAANVIVATVEQVPTGAVDLAGSTVWEELFIGSGPALIFTDGRVVPATWTKPSIHSVPTYTTDDGIPVPLTPGVTWVELAPRGATTWS